jgi:hypothetical protein
MPVGRRWRSRLQAPSRGSGLRRCRWLHFPGVAAPHRAQGMARPFLARRPLSGNAFHSFPPPSPGRASLCGTAPVSQRPLQFLRRRPHTGGAHAPGHSDLTRLGELSAAMLAGVLLTWEPGTPPDAIAPETASVDSIAIAAPANEPAGELPGALVTAMDSMAAERELAPAGCAGHLRPTWDDTATTGCWSGVSAGRCCGRRAASRCPRRSSRRCCSPRTPRSGRRRPARRRAGASCR